MWNSKSHGHRDQWKKKENPEKDLNKIWMTFQQRFDDNSSKKRQ